MGTPARNVTRLGEIIYDEGRKLVWLSRNTGIDASLLSRYTRGLHVAEENMSRIASALGRKTDELFDEHGGHLPPAGVPA